MFGSCVWILFLHAVILLQIFFFFFSIPFFVFESTAKLHPILKRTSFWWWKRTLSLPGTALTFQSAKISWKVKEILVFWSTGCRFFMDDNSKHKADTLDDGWVLDSEQTGEEESEIVSEWGKHCSVNCQNVSIFTFPPPPPLPVLLDTQNYLVWKALRQHKLHPPSPKRMYLWWGLCIMYLLACHWHCQLLSAIWVFVLLRSCDVFKSLHLLSLHKSSGPRSFSGCTSVVKTMKWSTVWWRWWSDTLCGEDDEVIHCVVKMMKWYPVWWKWSDTLCGEDNEVINCVVKMMKWYTVWWRWWSDTLCGEDNEVIHCVVKMMKWYPVWWKWSDTLCGEDNEVIHCVVKTMKWYTVWWRQWSDTLCGEDDEVIHCVVKMMKWYTVWWRWWSDTLCDTVWWRWWSDTLCGEDDEVIHCVVKMMKWYTVWWRWWSDTLCGEDDEVIHCVVKMVKWYTVWWSWWSDTLYGEDNEVIRLCAEDVEMIVSNRQGCTCVAKTMKWYTCVMEMMKWSSEQLLRLYLCDGDDEMIQWATTKAVPVW